MNFLIIYALCHYQRKRNNLWFRATNLLTLEMQIWIPWYLKFIVKLIPDHILKNTVWMTFLAHHVQFIQTAPTCN